MTISVWRYSHLALAIFSFIFIALASITGVILAFKPIVDKSQPYKVANFHEQNLAQLIPVLKQNFTDISDVSVDANQFVSVKATDLKDQSGNFIIDPSNGNTLGVVAPESEFFNWVTAFHRSLFLKEIGRFFVGITCFFLFLIAISGTLLIIQRQGSVKQFFKKIVKDNFYQYYHVLLGRLLLIPIIIIALTGTILSLQRFDLIQEQKISHQINYDELKSSPKIEVENFEIFKNIKLDEVKLIEFPFSEDVEDVFTLKLIDREINVNQLTGELLSEQFYNTQTWLTTLSMDWHTGKTSTLWSVILGLASINILFFIYSGFVIFLKRRSNRSKNKYKAAEAEYIILVGSENGSTFKFANLIYKQLLLNNKVAYVCELNQIQEFPNAKQFIVFAATYGTGEATTNANKFLTRLPKFQPKHEVAISVLAFGSKSYPNFCEFGYLIYNTLSNFSWSKTLTEIHTVNDRSPQDFLKWANIWSQSTGIEFQEIENELEAQKSETKPLVVLDKKVSVNEDISFILRLKTPNKRSFTSGDLLAIYPQDNHIERLYSIGKVNNEVQLSIKLHPGGLGSEFLYNLKIGDTINAALVKNNHFHFPKQVKTVIMVSNGTGIAPFLGMVNEFGKGRNIHLYCGFKNDASFNLYKEALTTEMDKLQQLKVAYSREGNKQYVKDLLIDDAHFILQSLISGAVLMLCGSLSMQKDVLQWLESLCKHNHNNSLSYYQSKGQILMDCY